MKPTCTSRWPVAASASMIRRQASVVVANGFSQKTGLPAAIEATTYCSWVGPHEHTSTACTFSSVMRSSPVRCTVASGSPAATSLASTSFASVTATTSAPETTSVSRRMWSRPIMPVPMTPTLSAIVCSLLLSVGPAAHGTEPAADVVAGGAGADGQWDVRLDRVEVLLNHGVDLAVELAEFFEQRRHVGLPVRRLAHDPELDRLRERHPLR